MRSFFWFKSFFSLASVFLPYFSSKVSFLEVISLSSIMLDYVLRSISSILALRFVPFFYGMLDLWRWAIISKIFSSKFGCLRCDSFYLQSSFIAATAFTWNSGLSRSFSWSFSCDWFCSDFFSFKFYASDSWKMEVFESSERPKVYSFWCTRSCSHEKLNLSWVEQGCEGAWIWAKKFCRVRGNTH
jgi:hypothetical protein